jgi:hypothetical protein
MTKRDSNADPDEPRTRVGSAVVGAREVRYLEKYGMNDVIHVRVAAERPMNGAPYVSRVAVVELAERTDVSRLELAEEHVVRTTVDARLSAEASSRHANAPGPEPELAPANARTTDPMRMALLDKHGPLEAKVFTEIGTPRLHVVLGNGRGFDMRFWAGS